APFSPVTSTIPGERPSSSEAYDRKLRRLTAVTNSPAADSAGQTDRHDQVRVVRRVALEHRGAKRADQLHEHRLRVDRLEAVPQELGVEADLDRLTRVRRRQRLLRLADILCSPRDRQLPRGEAETERGVPLREQTHAADDVEELLARELELVLELLGQQLAVVRELTVDPARREPDALGSEDDVILLQGQLDLLDRAGD